MNILRKVQLVIENNFAISKFNNKELEIDVYDRVFSRLVKEGGPIGKVHPIYLRIGDTLKTFGILTLNKNGSYSFFPEFPGELFFDHMTINYNIKKNRHHYTNINGLKRKKYYQFLLKN